MRSMKVGLDVDGVIADFYLSACLKYNQPVTTNKRWEVDFIGDKMSEIEKDNVLWGGLKVLNHPEKLTFEFDYYITAIPPAMTEIRREWIIKNGFPDRPIIVAEDKVKACLKHGIDVLIDDKPETLKQFRREVDLTGIQYNPYYSDWPNYGDYVVDCLTKVKPILVELSKRS